MTSNVLTLTYEANAYQFYASFSFLFAQLRDGFKNPVTESIRLGEGGYPPLSNNFFLKICIRQWAKANDLLKFAKNFTFLVKSNFWVVKLTESFQGERGVTHQYVILFVLLIPWNDAVQQGLRGIPPNGRIP